MCSLKDYSLDALANTIWHMSKDVLCEVCRSGASTWVSSTIGIVKDTSDQPSNILHESHPVPDMQLSALCII
jgi:hypothetical protein